MQQAAAGIGNTTPKKMEAGGEEERVVRDRVNTQVWVLSGSGKEKKGEEGILKK